MKTKLLIINSSGFTLFQRTCAICSEQPCAVGIGIDAPGEFRVSICAIIESKSVQYFLRLSREHGCDDCSSLTALRCSTLYFGMLPPFAPSLHCNCIQRNLNSLRAICYWHESCFLLPILNLRSLIVVKRQGNCPLHHIKHCPPRQHQPRAPHQSVTSVTFAPSHPQQTISPFRV